MKILFAASEAHPLVKTGGLGDVCGSLPQALKSQRHDVRLILPAYPSVLARAGRLEPVAEIAVFGSAAPVRILAGHLPDTHVPLYLVDAPALFERPGGPYSTPEGNDWPDNAERFGLFCRSVVEIAQDRAGLGFRPDIVHCHDWQTGLVPALLSLEPQRPATVFTIHNLAYQGLFDWHSFQTLHLPGAWWHMDALEFHGRYSFMKGGLVFADWISTVSPTYAEEIRTPAYGCGLDGLLRHRADRLVGILNGIDYQVWNPYKDPHLPAPYNAQRLAGKAANRTALRKHFGLPDSDVPLLGHVGRLVDQKGIDLLLAMLPELLHEPLQLVILGSGDKTLEAGIKAAAAKHPEHLAIHIGYSEELAHRIEAGSDIFLMPSRFEPCGLNQIYSLRYGAVPVVRRTGGLADTVVDATPTALDDGSANGFVFDEATPAALHTAVLRSLALFRDRATWTRLMRTGMRADFSWKRSAGHYADLYQRASAPTPTLTLTPHPV